MMYLRNTLMDMLVPIEEVYPYLEHFFSNAPNTDISKEYIDEFCSHGIPVNGREPVAAQVGEASARAVVQGRSNAPSSPGTGASPHGQVEAPRRDHVETRGQSSSECASVSFKVSVTPVMRELSLCAPVSAAVARILPPTSPLEPSPPTSQYPVADDPDTHCPFENYSRFSQMLLKRLLDNKVARMSYGHSAPSDPQTIVVCQVVQ
ncbi:hypothetical protein DVH05_010030 [Phytophthora capsici]|nr:hypothetical protein DVH05_010030 [Phytophthora capsici]